MKELSFILLIPIGGVVVTIFRQSLGIRILGPFRPILIALGLQGTGIILGLTFFTLVSFIILLIRPRLRAQKIPYFARLTILLCIVVTIELAMILLDRTFGMSGLGKTIYFPIVVLCLAAEGLGKLAAEKGVFISIRRAANMIAVAVMIYAISNLPGFMTFQLSYPEVILGFIGVILLVGKFLDFQWLNHAPRA